MIFPRPNPISSLFPLLPSVQFLLVASCSGNPAFTVLYESDSAAAWTIIWTTSVILNFGLQPRFSAALDALYASGIRNFACASAELTNARSL